MRKKKTIQELKNEGLVTTADKIAPPEPYDAMSELGKVLQMAGIPTEEDIENWVRRNEGLKEVENYCSENGLFPSDLIEFHRKLSKSNLKAEIKGKSGKETKVQDLTKPPNSNWRKEYIKNKTGIIL